MSRSAQFGRLGLQVVHASQATGAVNVIAAQVPSGSGRLFIGGSVSLGAIAPRVPDLSYSALDYGTSSDAWQVEVQVNGSTIFWQSWADILADSGRGALDDGKSYALVLLGPSLDFSHAGFWNPRRIAVVPTDP
jgi:hypothetical protein